MNTSAEVIDFDRYRALKILGEMEKDLKKLLEFCGESADLLESVGLFPAFTALSSLHLINSTLEEIKK